MSTQSYTSVSAIAEAPPAPRVYQPLPQALHLRDLDAAKTRAVAIYDFAVSQMPGAAAGRETGEWTFQDLERAIQDAAERVEQARYVENMARMQAEAEARQAAEQAKRDRLTLSDPAVASEVETLRRLNSAGLQLLLQADNLTPEKRVAATAIIKERAAEALAKITTPSAPANSAE